MEVWKDIKDYEGLYQVSNLGRVKSLHYRHSDKEVILKTSTDKNNYIRVGLNKNGKRKSYYIHVLVAQAFIPNPDNSSEVNHMDENPMNNRASNLEWCTHLYNSNYGTRVKRESIAHINHPELSKAVQCIETGVIYPSAHEAARQLGGHYSLIARCCRGERNKTCGYHWRYIEA